MDRRLPPRSGGALAPLTVEPPPPGGIGARIDLDLKRVDAPTAAAIRALVYEHKLVTFPPQVLTPAEQIAFARTLGQPQIYFQHHYHHPQHPEIFVSSNIPQDGKKVGVAGTGRYWHTDYQFFQDPLPLTTVLPRVVPPGDRSTCFIDMERVLSRLPAELRPFVEGTRARHEAKWRYKVQPFDVDKSIAEILEEFSAITPAVTHPTVITHPVNGRRLLYLSRGFTVGIEGLGERESRRALSALFDFAEREEHVHREPWTAGRLLLWDNRQLQHMAAGGSRSEASESHRVGIYDGLAFYADEARGRLAE